MHSYEADTDIKLEEKRETGVDHLAQAIAELSKELEHFYNRLAPVLVPEGPEQSEPRMLEVGGLQSPFGQEVERIRKLRQRLTEMHQRLDI